MADRKGPIGHYTYDDRCAPSVICLHCGDVGGDEGGRPIRSGDAWGAGLPTCKRCGTVLAGVTLVTLLTDEQLREMRARLDSDGHRVTARMCDVALGAQFSAEQLEADGLSAECAQVLDIEAIGARELLTSAFGG